MRDRVGLRRDRPPDRDVGDIAVNGWDFLIIGAIVAAVALAIIVIVRNKKRGKTSCGCGCDCSRCGGCSASDKKHK